MTVQIRPMVEGDKAQWRSLWSAYLQFYGSSVSEAIYDTTFERLIDPRRVQQAGFVAQKDGRLIGLVHLVYHPHNWRTEDVCYLQDLYVDPEARGTGVGRALIEAVYAEADRNGAPSVYWMTQDSNTTARKLYDKLAKLTSFIKYQR